MPFKQLVRRLNLLRQLRIRYLSGAVAVQFQNASHVITTRGLQSIRVQKADSVEAYALLATYGGQAERSVASFSNEDVALRVQRKVFKSLGLLGWLGLPPFIRKIVAVLFAIWAILVIASIGTSSHSAISQDVLANYQQSVLPMTVTPAATTPTDDAAAKESLRQRLKAEMDQMSAPIANDYKFSPKINVPKIEAPDLNCAKAAPQQITQPK